MQSLGVFGDGYQSDAKGVSGDGRIVVGSVRSPAYRPFRWTAAHGMEQLSYLPGGNQAGALAISGDGSVIVGWSRPGPFDSQYAVRWTADGIQSLVAPDGPGSIAQAVSRNGEVIVGMLWGGRQAFRWTALAGFQLLPQLGGEGYYSFAAGVSDDGRTIIGSGGRAGQWQRATLWRADVGCMRLDDYLASHGVDVSAWVLQDAFSISADGTVVVGQGELNGAMHAWLVRLPPPCGSSDFNGDGELGTDQDIEAFFACIAGQCCLLCSSADFDGDGDTATDGDIEAFFRALSGNHC